MDQLRVALTTKATKQQRKAPRIMSTATPASPASPASPAAPTAEATEALARAALAETHARESAELSGQLYTSLTSVREELASAQAVANATRAELAAVQADLTSAQAEVAHARAEAQSRLEALDRVVASAPGWKTYTAIGVAGVAVGVAATIAVTALLSDSGDPALPA